MPATPELWAKNRCPKRRGTESQRRLKRAGFAVHGDAELFDAGNQCHEPGGSSKGGQFCGEGGGAGGSEEGGGGEREPAGAGEAVLGFSPGEHAAGGAKDIKETKAIGRENPHKTIPDAVKGAGEA